MAKQDEKANRIMLKAVKRADTHDVGAEYTLPDYLPDITRLLKVSAYAEAPEKYLSAASMEYDGRIVYSVLYATAEGEIRCAAFDGDYSGSIPAPEADDFSLIHMTASAENPACRLSGPRKLSIKCRLSVHMDICKTAETDPVIGGKAYAGAESDLQYRKKRVDFAREIHASERAIPISEDVETEPSMPQIERVVYVNLTPSAFEARCSDGKINYSGAFLADILYQSADAESEYISFTRKIPVSGTAEAEGVTEDSIALCRAESTGLDFRPQTDELGETKTVEIDFDYSVYMRAFAPAVCELTADVYSLTYETSCESEGWKYLTPGACKTFNFSFNEGAELDCDNVTEVICAVPRAQITSVDKTGSKTSVSGTLTFHTVLCADGAYSGKAFSFPFKSETDAGRYPELFSYSAEAYASAAGCRIAGKKISFDTEITVCLAIFGEKEAQAVRSCTVFTDRPAEGAPGADVIIYYPTRQDDLWSIAKKYNTTVQRLASLNGITKETPDSAVIIPPKGK
jgi:hypothetical protein